MNHTERRGSQIPRSLNLLEKMAGKSLADKINALITTQPDFGSEEEPEDTKAKVELYNESDVSDDNFQTCKIRRQNVDTLDRVDKRYAGKKILRNDVFSCEDDSESEEDVEYEEMEQSDDEQTNLKEGSISILERLSDLEEQTDNDMNINDQLTIKTMSETNVRTEVEKGNCVRNQLKLWENFLEIRIKLQKWIVISNQMPQYDMHKELGSDVNFVQKVNETKAKLALIMENMLQLKDLLLKQYPETKNLCVNAKKRKIYNDRNVNTDDPMDEEIFSHTEDEENGQQSSFDEEPETVSQKSQKRLRYNDYEKVMQKEHDSYKEYRDCVIKKWNDKTWIATSSLSKNSSQTILKQIEFAMSDINKLRKRSQLKRSEYNIVGKSSLKEDNEDNRRIQEYDPEIYDDDDFYHQLLRDLIEYKSLDVTDPIQLSKRWIQLQNMRKKMKRKIDTRATKGRKVRYNVHNKLVNFMAPITVYNTWTHNAKNELYNSLFNKIELTEEQTK